MANCARCGAHNGATDTELRLTDLRIMRRILCDGCKERYRKAKYVADVIDLDPIDSADPLAPKGQGTCGESAGVITCSLGDLLSGATVSATVVVTTVVPAIITNKTSVASADSAVPGKSHPRNGTS